VRALDAGAEKIADLDARGKLPAAQCSTRQS
jgi:hypothetical protein